MMTGCGQRRFQVLKSLFFGWNTPPAVPDIGAITQQQPPKTCPTSPSPIPDPNPTRPDDNNRASRILNYAANSRNAKKVKKERKRKKKTKQSNATSGAVSGGASVLLLPGGSSIRTSSVSGCINVPHWV